ncbi:CRISPR-associated endoribonuclease Cas6 [Ectobacillus antri]|uniref:CRISPR-associated endoribonuclease Cas6 n=1 Tax=Ectobacillus antri TaxID=2486280 RepID=A0ABT6H8Q3_9BACI|nr:CRISPR-associated endoribonuclease Cas6 [Ectobacillus antri]MDG4656924.1 CRISPR-associated endoribonuclease Cas6 [Ectobacillus antri]MDG5755638.1 CRISPR-associated endoribonuclease Cas6 [Ectobacillus antri]
MRIHIKFQTQTFPLKYRMMIVSLIKEALQLSSKEYFHKIYASNNKKRPFSFGVYLHDYEIQADVFQVNGYVGVTVASPDPEFMLYFYNGIMSMDEFQYKTFHMSRMKVQMVHTQPVTGSVVKMKTLSPLLIQNKQAKPVLVDEPSFEKELNYISDMILREIRGIGLKQPLRFMNKNMKKVVVKENIHSGNETLFFTAYQGIFLLNGHPEDLEFLSEAGLGFRSSQGFGAVEVI